jgi:uncharacterized protein involved in exopolysaccharide biosynthesis
MRKDEDVDILAIVRVVWTFRTLLLKSVVIGSFLGVAVSFLPKTEFESKSVVIPEMDSSLDSKLSGLGSIAGLAGFNLDVNSSMALTPDLYPQVASSKSFLYELLKREIYFGNLDTTITCKYYFQNVYKPSALELMVKYSVGLIGVVKDQFSSEKAEKVQRFDTEELLILSKDETKLLERFRERVIVSLDEKSNLLTVRCEMPDPIAATMLCREAAVMLGDRVKQYKLEKLSAKYDFIEERFEESENEYFAKQRALAAYLDRNTNLNTEASRLRIERYTNELNLAFDVYKGLATQREQISLQIQEESPTFSLLEAPSIPYEKSSPKRFLIVLGFAFSAAVLSITYVIVYKSKTEEK